jgi:hypothetical protein
LGKSPSIVLQGFPEAFPKLIFQNDRGRYQFSLTDDAPSFETATFVLAVAAREMQRARASA